MRKIFPCCARRNQEEDVESIQLLYHHPQQGFHSLDIGPNPFTDVSGTRPPRPLPIPPSLQDSNDASQHVPSSSKRLQKYSVNSDVPYQHSNHDRRIGSEAERHVHRRSQSRIDRERYQIGKLSREELQIQTERRSLDLEERDHENDVPLATKIDASFLAARISLYKEKKKIAMTPERWENASRTIKLLKAELRVIMNGTMEISSDSDSQDEFTRAKTVVSEAEYPWSYKDESFRDKKYFEWNGEELPSEADFGETHLQNLQTDMRDRANAFMIMKNCCDESENSPSEYYSEIEPVRVRNYTESRSLQSNDSFSERESEFERLRARISAQLRANDDTEYSRGIEQRQRSIDRKAAGRAETKETKLAERPIQRSRIEPATQVARKAPIREAIGKQKEEHKESSSESELEVSSGETGLQLIRAQIKAKLRALDEREKYLEHEMRQRSIERKASGRTERSVSSIQRSGIEEVTQVARKAPVEESIRNEKEEPIESASEGEIKGSFGETELDRIKARIRAN
ncbi:hypothetical protein LOTGIDRAFT_175090, partial [Lottia gigantea]